jgi:hypothetical protein
MDFVTISSCHQFRCAVQALFRLDHQARGEAILAASVLAEFDQIWGATHRAHDVVKLVEPVAVPVRELGDVALRKGRLLMCDRVQGEGGIGDDPHPIAASDLSVHFGAIGLSSFALDARPSIRLAGAPIWLCGSSPMPWASRLRWSIRASMSRSASRSLATSAQLLRQRSTISVRFQSRTFWPKPLSPTERMVIMTWGMGFRHAVFAHIPMHVEIGDHAPIDEFAPNEVADELDALSLGHLAGNGELDLAGKPCIRELRFLVARLLAAGECRDAIWRAAPIWKRPTSTRHSATQCSSPNTRRLRWRQRSEFLVDVALSPELAAIVFGRHRASIARRHLGLELGRGNNGAQVEIFREDEVKYPVALVRR